MRRVLVANRGEIAVRIIRSCRTLGLETVAVHSEADRGALHTRLADRSVCIGPGPALQSYLNSDAVLTVARGTGCDAVHPGYGFLSENPRFAAACARLGLVFVGPSAEVIALMGDKVEARRRAAALGLPVLSGSSDPVTSIAEAEQAAARVGYPVLLKAAAGGGGRGMRIVRSADQLPSALTQAQAEARAAFGDDRIYLEQFLARARHIEVQVLGDGRGAVVELGERECSAQRRYQKLLEEAPSPGLPAALRQALVGAALGLARDIAYRSAGTVEFVVDADSGRFFFLEMNTRIQVEHPVTEMVTGRDLVADQLRIAAGAGAPAMDGPTRAVGHAIECRINAEAPEHGFRPSPGRITAWRVPEGNGIRVDTHGFEGYEVPPFYDSLLAKVVAHGADRQEAIGRMERALERFEVGGIASTIPFHRRLLAHPDFRRGAIHTRWVEERLLDGITGSGRS